MKMVVKNYLTGLSKLKYDFESHGISQYVAFLLRICNSLIFHEERRDHNNIPRWPQKLSTQDVCQKPLNRIF